MRETAFELYSDPSNVVFLERAQDANKAARAITRTFVWLPVPSWRRKPGGVLYDTLSGCNFGHGACL